MKRLFCFVLAFCMLVLNFASICAVESDGYEVTVVSELSDAELYAVLTENGFVFPEQVNEEKRCSLINGGLKKIVAKMENNPQYGVGASYTVLVDLYESIRDSLARIYGWDTSRIAVNAVNDDDDSNSDSPWEGTTAMLMLWE